MAAQREPVMASNTTAATRRSNNNNINNRINSQRNGKNDKNKITKQESNQNNDKKIDNDKEKRVNNDDDNDGLPPLPLVFVLMICSGTLFVFALRDFLMTGRNIAGAWDDPYLEFTKSLDWFDDRNGWKSTNGGFSAVQSVTTDSNNMGGFFVRKLAGAAALAVQLHKLGPFLFPPEYSSSSSPQWTRGDYNPLLQTAVLGNLATLVFFAGVYWEDLMNHGVVQLTYLFLTLLLLETVTILGYLVRTPFQTSNAVVVTAMPPGKTPSSCVSNIVGRTVVLTSSGVVLLAGRDLFAPGTILPLPRDDIYLEWTNAFIHSPPANSPEEVEHGLEAPLFVGDKFISQYAALHLLILCLYKWTAALWIRIGNHNDGRALARARLLWKFQALGNALLLWVLRIFAPAAASASLDLRYPLMILAYETFIVGLYGYF